MSKRSSKKIIAVMTAAILFLIGMIALFTYLIPKIFPVRNDSPSSEALITASAAASSESTLVPSAEQITSAAPDDTTQAQPSSEESSSATTTRPVRYPEDLPPEPPFAILVGAEIPAETESGGAYESETDDPIEIIEPIEIVVNTEYSDNSENYPYIGTWVLDYDLTPFLEKSVNDAYSLQEMPDVTVRLHMEAVLTDQGSFYLIYTDEDDASFHNALNDWFAQASSLYAKTTANPLKRAGFSTWSAYRKGLFSLLSPALVSQLNGSWNVSSGTLTIYEGGSPLAELGVSLSGDTLTVNSLTLKNKESRDAMAALQDSLGLSFPITLYRK